MISTRLIAASALLSTASLMACSGTSETRTPPAATNPAAPPPAGAAVTPGAVGTLVGTVAETMNSGGYTYARLQSDRGDVWVAAMEFPVKMGERLTVPLETPMQNFHSNTLNRDFPLIYFVAQVFHQGQTPTVAAPRPAAPAMSVSHQSATAAPAGRMAPPAGGLAIEDVWATRAALAGKAVTVRGKVVKFNGGIMERNWLHLQDGSGSASESTNDLTVTTNAVVAVGDIVTFSGVLGTSKDFGAGYAYDAILENAVVK